MKLKSAIVLFLLFSINGAVFGSEWQLECIDRLGYSDIIIESDNFNGNKPMGSVTYNYSNARIICNRSEPENLKCTGFWAGIEGDELAELNIITGRSGRLVAEFITNEAYGNIKINVECSLR